MAFLNVNLRNENKILLIRIICNMKITYILHNPHEVVVVARSPAGKGLPYIMGN